MMKQPGASITPQEGTATTHPKLTPEYEALTTRLERELAKGRKGRPLTSEPKMTPDNASAVLSEEGVKNDPHFIGTTGKRMDDPLQINPGDSAYRVTHSPKGEVCGSGSFRASEGTFGNRRELLGTKYRSDIITDSEYFAALAKIDEEAVNKKAFGVKKPPFTTKVLARLKKFFSGEPNKSPFTIPSEQHEPTLDTLRTKETPILTQATNQEGWSAYQAADEVPDVSDAEISNKYPNHGERTAEIGDIYKEGTSNMKHPVATTSSQDTPQYLPISEQVPQHLSSDHTSKKKDLGLPKEELDKILGMDTEGLPKEYVNTLIDIDIKKAVEKLRGNSEVKPIEDTNYKLVDDLFEDGLDAEVAEVERRKKLNLQERLGDWRTRLGKVAKRTTSKLETTLEKLGPEGKKLVLRLTQGSEYLNTKVNNPYVKLFAAAGLVSAGALAAYASPVVLASIAGAGLGMRVISAAGIYTFARKELDEKYKEWEKEEKNISALSKMGMEAGAIGFALFSGEMIGRAFEGIASSDLVRETAASIGDKVRETTTSLGDIWKNIFGEKTITIPPVTMSSQPPVTLDPTPTPAIATPDVPTAPPTPTTAPEATLGTEAAPINPDLEHIVKKGDNLWSLLRGDLAKIDIAGFDELSSGAKERMIREILDDMPVPESGKIDKIFPGDVVNFNGIDFQKYLDRQLQK